MYIGIGWIWSIEFYFSIWKISIWKTATLSTGPLQITNIESSNFITYPRLFQMFVIDPNAFEYNACKERTYR